MLKNLNGADEAKNEETVNQVNDVLIDLRNTVNRNVIPKNKNPDKLIDTVAKFLNFNKWQKGKELKILNIKFLNKFFKNYLQLLHK